MKHCAKRKRNLGEWDPSGDRCSLADDPLLQARRVAGERAAKGRALRFRGCPVPRRVPVDSVGAGEDTAGGSESDVALWRVRLFERGPLDVAKCSAGVWSSDKKLRAVLCQCPSKRVEGSPFCKVHNDLKKRSHGVWKEDTAELEAVQEVVLERGEAEARRRFEKYGAPAADRQAVPTGCRKTVARTKQPETCSNKWPS